jgi:hypothetical protein
MARPFGASPRPADERELIPTVEWELIPAVERELIPAVEQEFVPTGARADHISPLTNHVSLLTCEAQPSTISTAR